MRTCGVRGEGGGRRSGPVQMLLMCSGYDEIVLFISPVYFAGKGWEMFFFWMWVVGNMFGIC